MPLNPFPTKQKLEFQVVAKKMENDWAEPTLCLRILVKDGSEFELQATKTAMPQWNGVPKGVAHTIEIPRGCVKPYTGSEKTGIKSSFFARCAYKNDSLVRSQQAFPTHTLADHDVVHGDNLQQVADDVLFNIIGVVHSGGAPPAKARGKALPRRTVELFDKDWLVTLDLVGDLAAVELAPNANVVIVAVKKREYCGVASVETTRLSYVIVDPPWGTFRPKSEGSPAKKALKSEVLNITTIDTVKSSPGDAAARVTASMVPLAMDLFDKNIWVSTDVESIRLPVLLRDSTGDLPVSFWSASFGTVIPYNIDELSALWDACGNGSEAQQAFLKALNANAGKCFSWTLRPSLWTRTDGSLQIQWTVHAVNETDSDSFPTTADSE